MSHESAPTNPEVLPPAGSHRPQGAVRALSFPCRRCGADLSCAAGTAELLCGHCGHCTPIPRSEADIEELDLDTFLQATLAADDYQTDPVAACDSCGATFTQATHARADTCPFCGAARVMDGGNHRQIRPRALLPFAVDEEQARRAFERWLSRQWFIPNRVRRFTGPERGFAPVYLPYWTFDAATTSHYRGQQGIPGRSVIRSTKGRRVSSKLTWRDVSGVVTRAFDDVLVPATTSLPRRFTRLLYLAHEIRGLLVPYDASHLAGIRAEHYHIDLKAAFEQGRSEMDRQIRAAVRFDIGSRQQRIESIETRFGDITFKHILLPVWLSTYRDGDRVFRFCINGVSGRVQGQRPVSGIKIGAFLLGIAGVVTAAIVGIDAAF